VTSAQKTYPSSHQLSIVKIAKINGAATLKLIHYIYKSSLTPYFEIIVHCLFMSGITINIIGSEL
jgi:hypothetical protein